MVKNDLAGQFQGTMPANSTEAVKEYLVKGLTAGITITKVV